jgi:hypothetical protein
MTNTEKERACKRSLEGIECAGEAAVENGRGLPGLGKRLHLRFMFGIA